MRLLKVPLVVHPMRDAHELPKLVDFLPDRTPPYAILSHRWNASPSEEILFADLMQNHGGPLSSLKAKKGYEKFRLSCEQAWRMGFQYLWIDTCCIDKSSSAELSEAINTMFAWYNQAQVCLVYLSDVHSSTDIMGHGSAFMRTEWATRGWTLQELLAPQKVIFYSSDWQEIGSKVSLSGLLSTMTGIDEEYLVATDCSDIWSASVAKRMSWAARRNTSRPEDIAYCLMGLFRVNMPMLYGEGQNAFLRLQEEIMKQIDDHSLFAWTEEGAGEDDMHGLLAPHPRCFKNSGSIVPYEDREARAPFSMSNRGLCIDLHLTTLVNGSLYAAALDCPVPPNFNDSSFLAIYLKKLPYSHGQYARVKADAFGEAADRGHIETIYVRQSIVVPSVRGVFPSHILQLRKFKAQDAGYRVVKTVQRDATVKTVQAITTTQSTRDWLSDKYPTTCLLTSKGETRPLFLVHIVWEETESLVLVLGTANMDLGFSVLMKSDPQMTDEDQHDIFGANFNPLPLGWHSAVGYHRVRVSAEPIVSNNAKYYMIDIQLESLPRPRNLLEAVVDAAADLVIPGPVEPVQHRRTVMQRLKRPFGVQRIG